MLKLAVFTGTRAEYGLLFWLLKDIAADPELQLHLVVSGMHLSPEFGLTARQIEADGFEIDAKVEMLLSSDSPVGVAKSMGLGVLGLADAFARLKPDVLVLLGDRFEALAAAQTALVLRIPILHIHGGEVTQGAYDDAIRHAISKMSLLHCTSTEVHRQRVIQLGEAPERVKNVGALGLEHIRRTALLTRSELAGAIAFELTRPYFLVTFHPETLATQTAEAAFGALLAALDAFPDHQVILTHPNADDGGRALMAMLEAYVARQPERCVGIPSLGQRRYLSAVKHAAAVIGNSSSGIIEVPSFGVPTVNVGNRQKGREAAPSVLHCGTAQADIVAGIHAALQAQWTADTVLNPYGRGDTSAQILAFLKAAPLAIQKPFYDLIQREDM